MQCEVIGRAKTGEGVAVKIVKDDDATFEADCLLADLSCDAPPPLPEGWADGDSAFFIGPSQNMKSGDKKRGKR